MGDGWVSCIYRWTGRKHIEGEVVDGFGLVSIDMFRVLKTIFLVELWCRINTRWYIEISFLHRMSNIINGSERHVGEKKAQQSLLRFLF
jgi:hypothetical protein